VLRLYARHHSFPPRRSSELKSRAPKNFLGTIRRRIFWAARARTASARVVSVAPGAGIPLLRRESSVTSINAPDHAASACDRELRCAATGARFVMGGPTPGRYVMHFASGPV